MRLIVILSSLLIWVSVGIRPLISDYLYAQYIHTKDKTRYDYLKQAVVKRQPVVCAFPRAVASRNMDVLADRLLRRMANSDPADGNIKFFWKRLVEKTV